MPQEWVSARLDHLVTAKKGKKPKQLISGSAEGFIPYLDIYAIEKSDVRQFADVGSSSVSDVDDILVVWDGARSGWVGKTQSGAVGSTIMALTPYEVDSNYLFRYLLSQFQTINTNTRGTGIPHVDPEVFWCLEVPIPPLNEQRRIVAKLEEVLTKVDTSQQRLAKIPVILKRFRQAVLSAACSGRLTADWREANPDCNLSKVRQSDPLENGGVWDELPESWIWDSLAGVCERVVDCPHSTPKWTDTGKLCIRTTNFKPGFLDLSVVRYVSDETFAERIERLTPKAGDVIYSREGGILGIACIIPPGIELCLGQRMMLFRTKPSYSSALLMHWLCSPQILQRVRELTGGSAAPHLNVRDIKEFPVPLPPLTEQQEIVRRVESFFTLADQLEARYRTAKTHVDKLTQSILAKAFRGELVPQNPNDEPAAVLLERIRAERSKGSPARTRRS